VLNNYSTWSEGKNHKSESTIKEKGMLQVKTNPYYQQHFISFIFFVDKLEYDNNHVFSIEELGEITPTDIHRWMCVKAFGKEEVEPVDLPRLC
jgi:hypothetical protein